MPKSTRERLGVVGYFLQRAGVRIGLRYGGSFFLDSEDRTILENRVLPFYQISAEHESILFVGTDWATVGYVRMFAHKSLTTIDYDESKAPYGAPRHIVGDVTEIERYFRPGSLDLIVINGVLGWGLDAPADVEKTLAGFAACLRPGGHLIVGWNDLEGHRPVPFRELTSMRSFRPLILDCLGSSEIRVDNDWRHVFSLFERSSDVEGAGHR